MPPYRATSVVSRKGGTQCRGYVYVMRQLGQLTFDEWFMMDVSPDKAMIAVALHHHLLPLLSYPK